MEKTSLHVSVVIPVYQAEDLVDLLLERVILQLEKLCFPFEIILVEDGSADNSWGKIEPHCQRDPRIKGIKLAHNVGQHPAIRNGLKEARGEWVVVMDCDLQDRPEEIPSLYQKAQEGYEVVLGERIVSKGGVYSHLGARLFYWIFAQVNRIKCNPATANFGIYHQTVIQSILQSHPSFSFFPWAVYEGNFTKGTIPVQHGVRPRGKSSYTFGKKWKLAIRALIK